MTKATSSSTGAEGSLRLVTPSRTFLPPCAPGGAAHPVPNPIVRNCLYLLALLSSTLCNLQPQNSTLALTKRSFLSGPSSEYPRCLVTRQHVTGSSSAKGQVQTIPAVSPLCIFLRHTLVNTVMCSPIWGEVLSCTWHVLNCLITNPYKKRVGTLESLVTLCTRFLLCNLNPSPWKLHSQHNLL